MEIESLPPLLRVQANNQHPNVDEAGCFWNKKYNRYRPSYVCKEMEIYFVPADKFESESKEETTDED